MDQQKEVVLESRFASLCSSAAQATHSYSLVRLGLVAATELVLVGTSSAVPSNLSSDWTVRAADEPVQVLMHLYWLICTGSVLVLASRASRASLNASDVSLALSDA